MNDVHVMLDLETMGTSPNATIVSIAAVAFDLIDGEFCKIDEFSCNVKLESSAIYGGEIDAATVMWWLNQDPAVIQSALKDPISLTVALSAFSDYLRRLEGNLNLWGNGVDFDNLILRNAYFNAGLVGPWNHINNRCFRTLKNMFKDKVPEPEFVGTRHIALDDARHQALWLANILLYIGE